MSSKHDAKIVILGASGVGKTCLGLRFVKDQFVSYTASTIGASFLVKEVSVGNEKITLQIWDTAGQERFRTITQAYYRQASSILCALQPPYPAEPSPVPRHLPTTHLPRPCLLSPALHAHDHR